MRACDSCGASVAPDASSCDLCGTPVSLSHDPETPVDGARACPQCSNHPPEGSPFCNLCGAEMPTDPARPQFEPLPVSERPSSAAGRQGLLIVGIGVALVVGLYACTALAPPPDAESPATGTTETPQPEVGPAAPIPDGAPPLEDDLQTEADRYAALGTADGWYESGRYYLTAAFNAVQTDPTSSVRWARRAIEDFEQSLAIEDQPRVRVALAEAATFDPSDPMRPIQELQTVLAADPNNLDATYLLAERRLMIGRVDSARVALERILDLAPPGAPVRARAEAALATIDGSTGG